MSQVAGKAPTSPFRIQVERIFYDIGDNERQALYLRRVLDIERQPLICSSRYERRCHPTNLRITQTAQVEHLPIEGYR